MTTTATPARPRRTRCTAAAGPGNHWFYLLAQGTNPTDGQPTSPTCNGRTVSCSRATLTYYLWIDSDEGTGTAYDKLTVAVNGTTKATWSNINKGPATSGAAFP